MNCLPMTGQKAAVFLFLLNKLLFSSSFSRRGEEKVAVVPLPLPGVVSLTGYWSFSTMIGSCRWWQFRSQGGAFFVVAEWFHG